MSDPAQVVAVMPTVADLVKPINRRVEALQQALVEAVVRDAPAPEATEYEEAREKLDKLDKAITAAQEALKALRSVAASDKDTTTAADMDEEEGLKMFRKLLGQNVDIAKDNAAGYERCNASRHYVSKAECLVEIADTTMPNDKERAIVALLRAEKRGALLAYANCSEEGFGHTLHALAAVRLTRMLEAIAKLCPANYS